MALNFSLLILAVCLAAVSFSLGSSSISTWQGLADVINHQESAASMIFLEVRAPRTFLALLCGGALGLAGAALQGLLRNPLADPSLVGASQGAAVGAAIAFYYGGNIFSSALNIPLAGLLGAVIALFGVLFLAGQSRPILLILAGLAVSTVASAMLSVLLNFAPNPYAMQELVFWLLGSVANKDMGHVALLVPAVIIGSILVISQRRFLYSLTLGEEVSQTMGFNISRSSRVVILGSAVLVGSCVSVVGNIGFVGLIVPHILRPLVKYRPDRLLLPSAILGAALVTAADIFVRLLPPDRELKLGIVTSLIGAPLFIWLIWQERRKWV